MLDDILISPSQRAAIRELGDFTAKRAWLARFPACDIRDLRWYQTHFILAQPCISLFGVMPNLPGPWRMVVPHLSVAGICMIDVSAGMCVTGLLILWGRFLQKLGATQHVSSSLSKPAEMVVCYVLLIAGLLWVGITTYMPAWITAWLI